MQPHEQHVRFKRPRDIAVQLLGAFGGAFAWLLALGLQYGLVEVACGFGTMIWLHLATLFCLALAAAAFVLARRVWHETGREGSGAAGGPLARSRLFATLGVGASVFFAIVIFAQWLGNLFVHPCMAI